MMERVESDFVWTGNSVWKKVAKYSVWLMLVEITSKGCFGVLKFVMISLSDAEFSSFGSFVGFTICYSAVSTIMFEKIIASLSHSVYDGFVVSKVETVENRCLFGKVIADSDSEPIEGEEIFFHPGGERLVNGFTAVENYGLDRHFVDSVEEIRFNVFVETFKIEDASLAGTNLFLEVIVKATIIGEENTQKGCRVRPFKGSVIILVEVDGVFLNLLPHAAVRMKSKDMSFCSIEQKAFRRSPISELNNRTLKQG